MASAKLVPELLCLDLEASQKFYLELLGFSVSYERPEEHFAYLHLDGIELMLEQAPTTGCDERVWWTGSAERPFGRGINLQMEVSNVDAICDRLLQARWPLFRPMEEKWYRVGDTEAGNRQFLVQDPDGYLLRPFSHLGERPLA